MIAKILAWVVGVALAVLIVGLLSFRTPDTDPAAMRAKYADADSQFIDMGGGLTLHVRDTGPRGAPAIVLLHGSNASLHTWERWAKRLEGRYRIIRYDQPGHGLTGASPTRDYSAAASVDLVDRLTHKLGVTHFALAGNSMGSGVAWSYALAHPAKVDALILIDSVGQADPTNPTAPLLFRIARLPVLRDLATMVFPRSWIAGTLPSAYADPKLADAKTIDLYWELLLYPGNRVATVDRFASPPVVATAAQLHSLKMPVLILWGAGDKLIPVSSGQWLHANIPGSRLIVYPHTGHLVMEEAADRSATDVARFLDAPGDNDMALVQDLKALTPSQRSSIWASYLGWTLDAFDFFLLVFMLSAIAKEYGTDVKHVAEATFLTLAARPFGAFFFGWLADRFGRRPIMMIVILLFSAFSFASAFATSLVELFVVRALFGFAMGGEWGIGASLVMESIPAKLRGPVSGLLQSGYPSGYFLASLVYFLLYDHIGWRGMFMVGILPAILVFLIRMNVDESPAFEARRGRAKANPFVELIKHWKIAAYLVVLMTAFNFFSHGTQDLYPTFLREQHHFDTGTIGTLAAVMNIGAAVGGIGFGIWSEKIGRRRAIVIASLLALPCIPLWAFAQTPLLLGLGAFLMQVAVQGAWGIVPVHLNELSPALVRGMFPGFAYQLGNLIASRNGPLQASIAEAHGGDYGYAMALVAGITAVVLVVWTWFGPERRNADFVAEASQ